MKTYISITVDGVERKFSTFTKACKKMGLPYHFLRKSKLPVNYKGHYIERKSLTDIE